MNTLDNKTKEKFWIRLYFNPEKKHFHKDKIIVSAIRRAYRDFNRTLILGDNKDPNEIKEREIAKKSAEQYLEKELSKLYNKVYADQVEFDFEHKMVCKGLMEDFPMNYGQAQKWVNMSIKYLVLLGEDWVTGIGRNVQFYHPPFDNIVLDEMMGDYSKGIVRPWSKWDELEYKSALFAFRSMPKVDVPLISEFEFFNQEGRDE